MPETEQQKIDEEVIRFAKTWARFRFALQESDTNAIEVSIRAYNEIGSKEMWGKSVGTYYVELEVPKVVPTILLEIFNGRHIAIEKVFYEEETH